MRERSIEFVRSGTCEGTDHILRGPETGIAFVLIRCVRLWLLLRSSGSMYR